ncbi:MAG: hypothetical protein QM775_31525 [Pirellulales bacterium]
MIDIAGTVENSTDLDPSAFNSVEHYPTLNNDASIVARILGSALSEFRQLSQSITFFTDSSSDARRRERACGGDVVENAAKVLFRERA